MIDKLKTGAIITAMVLGFLALVWLERSLGWWGHAPGRALLLVIVGALCTFAFERDGD